MARVDFRMRQRMVTEEDDIANLYWCCAGVRSRCDVRSTVCLVGSLRRQSVQPSEWFVVSILQVDVVRGRGEGG